MVKWSLESWERLWMRKGAEDEGIDGIGGMELPRAREAVRAAVTDVDTRQYMPA
jgi:hypothetical protein